MNLIKENEKLVYKISNAYHSMYNDFEADDLAQVGFLTLAKAGHKFDPERGAVSTFITHCVTNAIRGHIKRNSLNKKMVNVDNLNSMPSKEEYFSIDEYFPDPDSIEVRVCHLLQEGRNRTEISKKIGTSVWHINKAIERIQERLGRLYEEKKSTNGDRS